MREDVQKTEDKFPIIGDIPLVGRAFRTNTEQHTKKKPVIFVTAKIITPRSIPLNEEEEGGLLPPELPEVPAYKDSKHPQITQIDADVRTNLCKSGPRASADQTCPFRSSCEIRIVSARPPETAREPRALPNP